MTVTAAISVFLFLLTLSTATIATAQSVSFQTDNPRKRSIDGIVDKHALEYMNHEGTIGLSIGLMTDDKFYHYNYGESEKAGGHLPTASTLYCYGSVGKTFVGILVAQAVLDHKIDLDADIRRYLPDGSTYTNLEFRGQTIKIVHLSNHTSGIPNSITPFPDNWGSSSADEKYLFKKSYDKRRFLDDLKTVTIHDAPGNKYTYSGTGVRLLAIILEEVYGRPYPALFHDYFTSKLRMRDTNVVQDIHDWNRFAVGDQDRNELRRTRSGFDDFTSAPGGVSTINDMMKYLKVNLAEKNPAFKLSHQPTWQGDHRQLGLVWRLETDALGEQRLFHTGRGLRNQCAILFYPRKHLALVVFTNDVIPDSFLDELCDRILHDILSTMRAR